MKYLCSRHDKTAGLAKALSPLHGKDITPLILKRWTASSEGTELVLEKRGSSNQFLQQVNISKSPLSGSDFQPSQLYIPFPAAPVCSCTEGRKDHPPLHLCHLPTFSTWFSQLDGGLYSTALGGDAFDGSDLYTLQEGKVHTPPGYTERRSSLLVLSQQGQTLQLWAIT